MRYDVTTNAMDFGCEFSCDGCGIPQFPDDLQDGGLCMDCFTSALSAEIQPRTGMDAESVCSACGDEWAMTPGFLCDGCQEAADGDHYAKHELWY